MIALGIVGCDNQVAQIEEKKNNWWMGHMQLGGTEKVSMKIIIFRAIGVLTDLNFCVIISVLWSGAEVVITA